MRAFGPTEKEFREAVHSAFYRIVRIRQPPVSEFFDRSIASTWPEGSSPSGWPDFWEESVAVEIQGAMTSRRAYLLDFHASWLKSNKAKNWETLVIHARTHLVPL
jgi:hypothetical protein